jgi:hypothetical protein
MIENAFYFYVRQKLLNFLRKFKFHWGDFIIVFQFLIIIPKQEGKNKLKKFYLQLQDFLKLKQYKSKAKRNPFVIIKNTIYRNLLSVINSFLKIQTTIDV